MNRPQSDTDWASRLSDMEEWYRTLLQDGAGRAEAALVSDYAPFQEDLGRLRGRVLDVGGGAGLARRYLHGSVEYHVIDPAPVWDEPQWRAFAEGFGGDGPAIRRHVGSGEALPFDTASFDAVVAFWSLNHAADPTACLAEMARVARPGGSLLLVLEDMEPSWRDVASFAAGRVRYLLSRYRTPFPTGWGQPEISNTTQTIRTKLTGRWPLQADHVRIDEAAFAIAAQERLHPTGRRWAGGFLTLTFCRMDREQ